MDFSIPDSSVGKESTCNAEDLGLIPGLGRSPGEGKGYPLQYSGLENFMDCIVHGVAKSQTQLSNFHFFFLSNTTVLHDPQLVEANYKLCSDFPLFSNCRGYLASFCFLMYSDFFRTRNLLM